MNRSASYNAACRKLLFGSKATTIPYEEPSVAHHQAALASDPTEAAAMSAGAAAGAAAGFAVAAGAAPPAEEPGPGSEGEAKELQGLSDPTGVLAKAKALFPYAFDEPVRGADYRSALPWQFNHRKLTQTVPMYLATLDDVGPECGSNVGVALACRFDLLYNSVQSGVSLAEAIANDFGTNIGGGGPFHLLNGGGYHQIVNGGVFGGWGGPASIEDDYSDELDSDYDSDYGAYAPYHPHGYSDYGSYYGSDDEGGF